MMTSGLWMGRGRGTLRGRRAPALLIPGRGPHSKRCARGMSGVAGVDAKECRERALRCSELAERATDPHLNAVLKQLAERSLKSAV
jgi:hypothetical protein